MDDAAEVLIATWVRKMGRAELRERRIASLK
jgi:hypothetical protein